MTPDQQRPPARWDGTWESLPPKRRRFFLWTLLWAVILDTVLRALLELAGVPEAAAGILTIAGGLVVLVPLGRGGQAGADSATQPGRGTAASANDKTPACRVGSMDSRVLGGLHRAGDLANASPVSHPAAGTYRNHGCRAPAVAPGAGVKGERHGQRSRGAMTAPAPPSRQPASLPGPAGRSTATFYYPAAEPAGQRSGAKSGLGRAASRSRGGFQAAHASQ